MGEKEKEKDEGKGKGKDKHKSKEKEKTKKGKDKVKEEEKKNDDMPLAELKAQVEGLMNQAPPSPSTKPASASASASASVSALAESPAVDIATDTSTNDMASKGVENAPFKMNITIPSNIVGLLLVAKNRPSPSILNQIQRATTTRVSRVDPSGETEGAVPFVVQGQNTLSVETAAKAIEDIVNGNRITDVIKGLEVYRKKIAAEARKAKSEFPTSVSTGHGGGVTMSEEASDPRTTTSVPAAAAAADVTGVSEDGIKAEKGKKVPGKKGDKAAPKKKEERKGGKGKEIDDGTPAVVAVAVDGGVIAAGKPERNKKNERRDRDKKTRKSEGIISDSVEKIPSLDIRESGLKEPVELAEASLSSPSLEGAAFRQSSTGSIASTAAVAQEAAAPSPKPATAPAASSPPPATATTAAPVVEAPTKTPAGSGGDGNGSSSGNKKPPEAVSEDKDGKDCVI